MDFEKYGIQKLCIDYDSVRRKNIFLFAIHHSGNHNAIPIAFDLEKKNTEKVCGQFSFKTFNSK
jgi:hypothetical protein